MLNPDQQAISVPTLLKITSGLSAFAEGGFLVALSSYIHEHYGQLRFGVFQGHIITGGALGLIAFDELVHLILRVFAKKEKNAFD